MTKDQFVTWRASIPFTDEQIVEALQEVSRHALSVPRVTEHYRAHVTALTNSNIAYVRRGGLSGRIVQICAPHLVKFCGICGKTALYRYGLVGRCRVHRDRVPLDYEQHHASRAQHGAAVAQRREAYREAVDGARAHRRGVDRKRAHRLKDRRS